ncbi:MAG: hypothetical protein GX089_01355 [Fibrobacter sp.]|jgi:hypothetical protein|nr:hypothetical protein [Fibrobacter sp.]
MLATGIPMTIAGIVLGTIGTKKVREYKNCLDDFSLDFRLGKEIKYLGLIYRF